MDWIFPFTYLSPHQWILYNMLLVWYLNTQWMSDDWKKNIFQIILIMHLMTQLTEITESINLLILQYICVLPCHQDTPKNFKTSKIPSFFWISLTSSCTLLLSEKFSKISWIILNWTELNDPITNFLQNFFYGSNQH